MSAPVVSKLISRNEFRVILRNVVRCLKGELNAPGLAPLSAEEIQFWFQNITLEDIQVVMAELAAEPPSAPTPANPENASKVHSVLRKLREKMRSSETAEQGEISHPEQDSPST